MGQYAKLCLLKYMQDKKLCELNRPDTYVHTADHKTGR